MLLKNFKKIVFDTHLSLRDMHDRELEYVSEITGDSKKYDECQVAYIQSEDYRLLKVYLIKKPYI